MSGIKLLKSKKIGGSKSGNIFNSSGDLFTAIGETSVTIANENKYAIGNAVKEYLQKEYNAISNGIVMEDIKTAQGLNSTKGGKNISAKSEYINKLKKYNVKTLKSYASKINIKTTKRLNGKLVNLTKEALIKRLANYKYKK